MDTSFYRKLFEEHQNAGICPSPEKVDIFFNRLLGFLFPQYSDETYASVDELRDFGHSLQKELCSIIARCSDCMEKNREEAARDFMQALPGLKDQLERDIQATYAGDPAAKTHMEVIRTYPGFYAIASYRIAHYLHQQGYLLLARMITENAHSRTGVDIHPGARIGSHFCIDHGTGVVIGETTRIGDHVKIYQGVTIGALSVKKEDAAKQRHPTIGNHVVIYAGATILGGDTVIGDHSIIGGNVWLINSVPPWTRISYVAQQEKSSNGPVTPETKQEPLS